MRPSRCLAAVSAMLLATAAAPAAARVWVDPNARVFQNLEPWQLVVVALLAVALTGLFLFLLVRLIYRIFGRK